MESTSTRVIVGTLAALLMVFIAYSIFHHSPKPTPAVCAIVVDRTPSAASTAIEAQYTELADVAIRNCASRNAPVAVWQVSSSPSATSILDRFTWTVPNGGGSQQYLAHWKSKEISQYTIELNSQLGAPVVGGAGGSDIDGIVNQAISSLQQANGATNVKRYLVVLTDGMQETSDVSVESLGSSILSSPTDLVKQTMAVYPAFDLQGVNASFYGVDGTEIASNGKPFPHWFEKKIQQYWTDLFSSNGGTVCTYQDNQSNSNVLCGS